MVQSTRELRDDISNCENLLIILIDFGTSRALGALLISDPATTFEMNEADLPEETMKQMRADCESNVHQESVKRAVEDITVHLEHLLTNHNWARHEIDDEAFAKLDLIIIIIEEI